MMGVLGWLMDRLFPSTLAFTAFVWVFAGVTLAIPLAAAFFGARRFGKPGGVVAMLAGWVFALYAGISMMALFSGCRSDHRCSEVELFHSAGEFLTWAATTVFATLPWQIAWIAAAVAGLYAGLRVRRRKLATV